MRSPTLGLASPAWNPPSTPLCGDVPSGRSQLDCLSGTLVMPPPAPGPAQCPLDRAALAPSPAWGWRLSPGVFPSEQQTPEGQGHSASYPPLGTEPGTQKVLMSIVEGGTRPTRGGADPGAYCPGGSPPLGAEPIGQWAHQTPPSVSSPCSTRGAQGSSGERPACPGRQHPSVQLSRFHVVRRNTRKTNWGDGGWAMGGEGRSWGVVITRQIGSCSGPHRSGLTRSDDPTGRQP